MPPPRKPHAPRRKGGLAPRRFNVLSAALGSALSVEELTARMEVIHSEAAARTSVFVDVISSLLAEKIHAAVARHWLSTLASRDYLYELERKEFDSFVAQHQEQLKTLRSSVAPEAVARKQRDALDEEMQSRKRIILLEQKMFDDFFLQLGRMILMWEDSDMSPFGSHHHRTNADGTPATNFFLEASRQVAAAETARQARAPAPPGAPPPARRKIRMGKDGKPLVHLCDGCPFIHAEDCPFYAAEWVSKDAFVDQHMKRRLPRLHPAIRLEQLSYEKLLKEREEHVAKLNVRFYQSRLLNA